MERPVGVTILTFAAVVLAFLNAIVMLRFFGFLPFLGAIEGRIFSLCYALLYGLLCIHMGVVGSDTLAGRPASLDVSGCYHDIQSVH